MTSCALCFVNLLASRGLRGRVDTIRDGPRLTGLHGIRKYQEKRTRREFDNACVMYKFIPAHYRAALLLGFALGACLNDRPSPSVADLYWPPRDPSFIGCASIVILSPGFTLSAFHPCAAICPTEPISKAHSSVRPVVASTTSTWSQQCGFVNSNSSSVPETVIAFSLSNIEKE